MARTNLGAHPNVYPEPVLILAAYNEDGTANAMNAAWGGISGSKTISMCVSAGHKTVQDILRTKAFTVNVADAAHVKECDYFGIASGNKVPDKVASVGMTVTKAEFVNAPVINELPLALECRLVTYDSRTNTLIGAIMNINADENVLDEGGNVDIMKVQPITFDSFNSTYHVIGEQVGVAWQSGRELIKVEDL